MDWGDISENIPIIAMIIGLILLQIFLRRRRGPQTGNRYIAESLMSEIRVNLRLAEVLAEGEPIKRFITTSWKINRNKIEFLEQQVQSALTDAFTIAEDYNQQVAASRKYRSNSYIASIDVQKLQAKLTSSKEGLEQWFLSTTGSKEPPTQSPGIFDGLIGRR